MAEQLFIRTCRLELIAVTVELIRAEMSDIQRFSTRLKAHIPQEEEGEAWPPENIRDVMGMFSAYLERDPGLAGWLNWYWVLIDEKTGERTLIGNGGFTSRPVNGTVATGYSVLRQYQSHGYATEAEIALVKWAFSHAEVDRVIAEAASDNSRSVRVLEKVGFSYVGKGSEEGHVLYELKRSRTG